MSKKHYGSLDDGEKASRAIFVILFVNGLALLAAIFIMFAGGA